MGQALTAAITLMSASSSTVSPGRASDSPNSTRPSGAPNATNPAPCWPARLTIRNRSPRRGVPAGAGRGGTVMRSAIRDSGGGLGWVGELAHLGVGHAQPDDAFGDLDADGHGIE